MKTNTKLLLWTTGTSFLASLSLGTLNLRVAGFAFTHDLVNARLFSLASIIIQMLASRLALALVGRTNKLNRLTNFLTVVTAGTMILLAIHFLETAGERMLIITPHTNGFPMLLNGSLISLVSTLRIPSWLAWMAMLKCKRWFDNSAPSYNYYTMAIGLGCLLSFIAYGLAGYYLAAHLIQYHHVLNRIIGVLLIIIASRRLFTLFGHGMFRIKPQFIIINRLLRCRPD